MVYTCRLKRLETGFDSAAKHLGLELHDETKLARDFTERRLSLSRRPLANCTGVRKT